MKVNHLLNEILKGQWLLDPQFLESAVPYVHSYLTGGSLKMPFADQELPQYKLYDEDGGVMEPMEKEEEIVQKIAFVSMVGPVHKYGDCCSHGAIDIVDMLDRANNDDSVKGTVLYVDGPGGAVSAINPFIDFATRKKKPVVVLADMAASLHYWTLCAVADHIIGENKISGRFGSIGVVSSFVDTRAHWEKKGYVFHEIYPEESKHKNEVFNLALEGKYDRIKKEHLSPIAISFQNSVKAARPNLVKDRTGVLTGATFGTEEALELGMIDSIGNMKSAIDRVNLLVEVNQFNNQ